MIDIYSSSEYYSPDEYIACCLVVQVIYHLVLEFQECVGNFRIALDLLFMSPCGIPAQFIDGVNIKLGDVWLYIQ
jgi:hypothetical protein